MLSEQDFFGAEGMGLEPISPFGQRFSSVWPGVLRSSSCSCLVLFLLVRTCVTSWLALGLAGSSCFVR